MKTVTTEVDADLWKRLKIECARRDIKVQEAIRAMIVWFLSSKEGA